MSYVYVGIVCLVAGLILGLRFGQKIDNAAKADEQKAKAALNAAKAKVEKLKAKV